MMRGAVPLVLCAMCFAGSEAVFPAMRKRLEEKKTAAALVQKQEPEETAAPAVVPEAVDAGADGFPKLPAVSTILGGATTALKTVHSQANEIETRVVAAQNQIQGKLAHQKAAFEFQLKKQETENLAVTAQNSQINKDTAALKEGNIALRKQAHSLQKSNSMLRSEVHALESRLGVAKDFAKKTLSSTDDSNEPKLEVLHFAKPVAKEGSNDKKEDSEDGDDYDDDDADEVSLLQVSTEESASADGAMDLAAGVVSEPGADSDDLLATLTKDVAHLAAQEKDSQKQLKDIFIKDFRAGAQRHKALMLQQKIETNNKNTAQAMQQQLQKAVTHLEDTHVQLSRRLKGLGSYIKQLAHLALSKETDMPRLLEKLPKGVSLAAKPKPLV